MKTEKSYTKFRVTKIKTEKENDGYTELKMPDVKMSELKVFDLKVFDLKMVNIGPDVKISDLSDLKMNDLKMTDFPDMPDLNVSDFITSLLKMPDVYKTHFNLFYVGLQKLKILIFSHPYVEIMII